MLNFEVRLFFFEKFGVEMLAERINRIEASRTMQVAAKAKELMSKGIDIVDLSVGEPDFPTPENVKLAGIRAIEEDFTKYTVNVGLPELREAIAKKLKRENALDYSINEIIVSNGAKQSLFNAILTLVNPDDEVLIPAPYWVSYPNMVSLANGKSVFIETKEENEFKLTPDLLQKNITPKTKLLILCNPSNPTGTVYSEDELHQIAEIIEENGLYVLADEIYEKLVYDDFKFVSFASIKESLKEQTVLVNGVSKAYSMTGWRLGYAAGSKEIIDGMAKIQSHSTSNASSISQMAAIEAFASSQDEVEKMRERFEQRRNLIYEGINNIKGLSAFKPVGAFYLFVNIQNVFGKKWGSSEIKNSLDFSLYLLEKANVAVVPGSAFGTEGFVRISYATSEEILRKGIERIKAAVEDLG